MRIRRQATDGEKTETSPKKTDRWQISTRKEPPHVIKEMQIKTARCYHMPIRRENPKTFLDLAKSKTLTTPNIRVDEEQ